MGFAGHRTWIVAAGLILAWIGAGAARATDSLVATQACPAYQSIAKKTNPGHVRLQVGQSYDIVARNKQPPTHFRVEIAGAAPKERWVAVSCGHLGGTTTPPSGGGGGGSGGHHGGGSGGGGASDLLALSWQPTFCRSHPQKAECLAETAASPEAKRLSLHGLWPEPNGTFYCIANADQKKRLAQLDQASEWALLPDPGETGATHDRLAAVMPGTQSLLERHEWVKHGTCFGTSADVYFNRAADLVEQMNASAVGQLLADNVGKSLTSGQILAAFKAAFGDAAPAAVQIKCAKVGGANAISEIDVYLAGDVAGSAPLAQLLHKAPNSALCAAGVLVRPAH